MPPNKSKKWLYIILAIVIAGLVVGAFFAGRLTGGGSETPTEAPATEALLGEAFGELIDNIPETPTETPTETQEPANGISEISKNRFESSLEEYETNTQKLETLFGQLDCVDQETFREDVVPLTERQKILADIIANEIDVVPGGRIDKIKRAKAASEEMVNVLASMPGLCLDDDQSPPAQQGQEQEIEQEFEFPVYESIFD